MKPAGAAIQVPDEILEIVNVLEAAGHEAWCVGGALRDALRGEPQSDFDVATSAHPEEVRRLFRRTVPVGIAFGTVGVLDRHGGLHEVTTFRKDVSTDGRRAVVEYGVSLDEDLARRDFTINAIAFHPITHEWRDPFNGLEDLKQGLLRAVGAASDRFREDYLRILRLLRFAARFSFRVDPATWEAAREAVTGLGGLSAERVRDEWFKSLRTAAKVEDLVRLWHEAGAAPVLLPELTDAEGAASLHVSLAGERRDPVMLTIALCRNPDAVLERLRASNAEVARAAAVSAAPAFPADEETAVRRWLAQVGEAADDVFILHRLQTGALPPIADTVQLIRRRADPLTRSNLAVNGRDLIEAGISPGPALGRALDRLLDRVLEDPALNTRDSLLTLAREID
ncbi:MAG: CCA tRNA nucleotidyltransferase [Gemmatimonadales bacterium]